MLTRNHWCEAYGGWPDVGTPAAASGGSTFTPMNADEQLGPLGQLSGPLAVASDAAGNCVGSCGWLSAVDAVKTMLESLGVVSS